MENSNNSYSHILKYTSLFGGVQMLNILIGLVRNKLVAVLLGPAGMGLVALFSSTIKLVVDSTNFGLHISAVRNISMAFDNGDEKWLRHAIEVFRHWILITALFGLVVCAALYAAVPMLYKPGDKTESATSFRQELTGNDIK